MDSTHRPAAPRAPSPQPLQRGRRTGPVDPSWLSDFSQSPEARHLARLQADNELLNHLMWSGYEGAEWDLLRDRLVSYGYQVLFSWLRNGRVFALCQARGTILLPTRRSRDPDEARSLAGETTTLAVVKFRNRVLIPRVWRPDGNASLDTFFVGQCLIRFPNIYRRWLREHGWGGCDALGDVQTRRGPALDAVAERAQLDAWGDPESGLALEAYLDLAGGDPKTRRVLELVAAGHTYPEIAEQIGISVPSIKSRLYRLRASLSGTAHDAA